MRKMKTTTRKSSGTPKKTVRKTTAKITPKKKPATKTVTRKRVTPADTKGKGPTVKGKRGSVTAKSKHSYDVRVAKKRATGKYR